MPRPRKYTILMSELECSETLISELQKEHGYRVSDASHHYSGYKDLNEYLCAGVHLKSRQAPVKPVQKQKGDWVFNAAKNEMHPVFGSSKFMFW